MPLQLPSGRVLYAYRNHDRTGDDLHYTYFRISISYSDDGGNNFKYLSTVEEKVPNGVSGLWEPYCKEPQTTNHTGPALKEKHMILTPNQIVGY